MKSAIAFLLAFALPLGAAAAPIAPSGADPTGLGGAGPAAYATAGLPSFGVGADLPALGGVVGAEAGYTLPGVLRPELHARWPLLEGPVVLAPRFALAYSLAARGAFGTIPAQSTFEAAPGVIAGWRAGSWGAFVDAGLLGLYDFGGKARLRVVGTAAAGATLLVSQRLAVTGHLGLLLTSLHAAPAGGVTASWTL